MFTRLLKKIMWYLPVGGKLSQAYEGEDIMLWRLFTEVLPTRNGFYVDVGAFHPRQYSNTWLLRKRLGFHGINIEPSKKSMRAFFLYSLFTCKRDNNIGVICSDKRGLATYKYNDNEPSHSTVSLGEGNRYSYKLADILHLYKIFNIDLLSIDVEGHEFQVLQGHDWRIRPKVIICEINDDITSDFIREQSYELYGKTRRNEIYVEKVY